MSRHFTHTFILDSIKNHNRVVYSQALVIIVEDIHKVGEEEISEVI